ncbi:DUF2225 domain-containing protein [Tumebacillus permanentifrigoris]|uniref:DUF2225 domain-containing protein n=1 Tax=Tumebacillus permanentifrigoris TaxID=378543 RepID=A0A316DCQ0_9BACL|nr:DUF2225 domain-containing protein [Tumebacillus permanentifrigoris]PWK15947.1 hypothetical protein C7459_102193 [Tumebacillus permanentifrigoris]
MTTTDGLYDRKVRCPLCEETYNTKKVLTRAVKVLQTEGDFYARYGGPNPIHYLINVCTTCGFSFLEKTQPRVTSLRRQQYVSEVASKWVVRDYCSERTIKQAVVSFKLAIFCAQFVSEPSRTIGGLCLHLAWLYRELGDVEEEQRFLRDALEFYIDAFEHDSRLEDNGKMPYLIGELSRRVGDDKQAVLYFNQVIQDRESAQKYIKLARDQWGLLREARAAQGLKGIKDDGTEEGHDDQQAG